MRGLITNRDVLRHFGLIWVEFGPTVALSCVGAMFRGERTTFLDLAFRSTPALRVKARASPQTA